MAAETVRRQEYETAFAAFQAPYAELDRRIRAFNADYARRMSYRFTIYEVDETVTETRTLTSDPGKILSGGAMTLAGTVINDKSQIAAGGALVAGPDIENIGAQGRRTVALDGTSTYTAQRQQPAPPFLGDRGIQAHGIGRPMEVPVGTAGGNTSVPSAARRLASPASPRPAPVPGISLPGGTVVRTVSNPASIPDSQLFAVNNRPDAPYIVATDPRFTGQRPTCPATTCSTCCARPAACREPQRATRSAPAARWPALAPGQLGCADSAGREVPHALGQPKRLGDGFMNRRPCPTRSWPPPASASWRSSDNDTQYKALLAAGAKFAQDNGIKLGVALTEAQQRQLTTDRSGWSNRP